MASDQVEIFIHGAGMKPKVGSGAPAEALVRAPVHDGRDSGMMADTIPAA